MVVVDSTCVMRTTWRPRFGRIRISSGRNRFGGFRPISSIQLMPLVVRQRAARSFRHSSGRVRKLGTICCTSVRRSCFWTRQRAKKGGAEELFHVPPHADGELFGQSCLSSTMSRSSGNDGLCWAFFDSGSTSSPGTAHSGLAGACG